jgi:hypothetical protein
MAMCGVPSHKFRVKVSATCHFSSGEERTVSKKVLQICWGCGACVGNNYASVVDEGLSGGESKGLKCQSPRSCAIRENFKQGQYCARRSVVPGTRIRPSIQRVKIQDSQNHIRCSRLVVLCCSSHVHLSFARKLQSSNEYLICISSQKHVECLGGKKARTHLLQQWSQRSCISLSEKL